MAALDPIDGPLLRSVQLVAKLSTASAWSVAGAVHLIVFSGARERKFLVVLMIGTEGE